MYCLFSINTFSYDFGKVSGRITGQTCYPAPPQEVESTTITCSINTFRWRVNLSIPFFIYITSQAYDCLASTWTCSGWTEKNKNIVNIIMQILQKTCFQYQGPVVRN